MPKEKQNIQKIIESLSPNEIKIIPFLKQGNLDKIHKESNLDKVVILRALEFLSNKNLLKISSKEQKTIELGLNGLLYVKKGL